MHKGTENYRADSGSVAACGIVINNEQFVESVHGPIKDILLDNAGISELGDILASLASTDFDQTQLAQLLQVEPYFENWVVGEVFAESYIADNDNCIFPWPTSRDLKNPKASPAGADLVGFQAINDGQNSFRFAFGEVKTSVEHKFPPNVVNSLKDQLVKLRDSHPIRQYLILYLGHRALKSDLKQKYKSAVQRYIGSKFTDVALFGVLIRDVSPDQRDLESCAATLAENCPMATSIKLYALYFPLESISTFASEAKLALRGAGQ